MIWLTLLSCYKQPQNAVVPAYQDTTMEARSIGLLFLPFPEGATEDRAAGRAVLSEAGHSSVAVYLCRRWTTEVPEATMLEKVYCESGEAMPLTRTLGEYAVSVPEPGAVLTVDLETPDIVLIIDQRWAEPSSGSVPMGFDPMNPAVVSAPLQYDTIAAGFRYAVWDNRAGALAAAGQVSFTEAVSNLSNIGSPPTVNMAVSRVLRDTPWE